MRHIFLLSGTALLLSACAISDPAGVRLQQEEGYSLYSTTAAVRSYQVRQENDNRFVCAEPAPDVALDEDASGSFSLSLLNFGDKTEDSIGEGVAEAGLGGRSVNVLITREMFFRMCEFMANTTLSDSDRKALFEKTLDAVVNINAQSLGTGTQNQAGANVTLSSSYNQQANESETDSYAESVTRDTGSASDTDSSDDYADTSASDTDSSDDDFGADDDEF